jgi:hypothetical protein
MSPSRKAATRRRSPNPVGLGVKEFPGQGANLSHAGLPKDFRLIPESSWSAETTFLKTAAGVKYFLEWLLTGAKPAKFFC